MTVRVIHRHFVGRENFFVEMRKYGKKENHRSPQIYRWKETFYKVFMQCGELVGILCFNV